MYNLWVFCGFDDKLRILIVALEFKKDLTVMAKEASNGDNNGATKPPPSPSPLRNSKFFQVMMGFFYLVFYF